MKTTRRMFLRSVGAGTTCAWLTTVLPGEAYAQHSIRQSFDPRIAQQFLSVCRQCPAGCGVLAEVVEGQVKKLRGNPLHPTNRGSLCARGISAIQLYYNPDRIQTPLRRRGARGAGDWEAISWDAAYELLAAQLVALRNSGRSHAFALLAEDMNGLEGQLARRFCRAYGTPNYLDLSGHPTEDAVNAATVMQGLDGPAVFDIKNASFLLSFNVPFLDTPRNPVQTWKHFAEFRSPERGVRGRLVHFSSMYDTTARKADEWIPLVPGTEGALALGMAYVIIQEGLYDRDFINFHCQGFDTWWAAGEEIPGFRVEVHQNYKPSLVAEITGVSVEKIVSLAREFSQARAPLALWQGGTGVGAQPLSTQMAIHSLNALVGNIDVPGGVLAARRLPLDLPAAAAEDEAGRAGRAQEPLVSAEHTRYVALDPVRTSFPERIVLGSPYPVEALLIYRANPVFHELNGRTYREALEKVPFSACIAGFHNETTQWCDLVLPESHALESWYAGVNYTEEGYPFLNVCEPATAPRHDTAHAGDMVLELARRCGGAVAESLPWPRIQDVAAAYLAQVNGLESGDTFGRRYEEIWTRLLERIGWRARGQMSDTGFWRAALTNGGWWDPIYFPKDWARTLKTRSGRFEFFPDVLWRRLRRFRRGETITPADKARILPHYEAPAGAVEDYPLRLLVFAMPNLTDVESPNQPWLQEIAGRYERHQWAAWLAVNPEDAEHYHLEDGGEVWIESLQGQVKLPCELDPGVPPGTVRMPFGYGHTAGGRWMKDIGVSPAAVVSPAYDAQSGLPDWQATSVRLRKA